MRTNGTLSYERILESGVDSSGEAIPARTLWSDAIPCSIKVNNDTRKGKYEDGEFRQASYTVLIELDKFPYPRIKLERLGEQLGEYRVLSVEPLTTIGRVKILI